jgi:hypothetical protein
MRLADGVRAPSFDDQGEFYAYLLQLLTSVVLFLFPQLAIAIMSSENATLHCFKKKL